MSLTELRGLRSETKQWHPPASKMIKYCYLTYIRTPTQCAPLLALPLQTRVLVKRSEETQDRRGEPLRAGATPMSRARHPGGCEPRNSRRRRSHLRTARWRAGYALARAAVQRGA